MNTLFFYQYITFESEWNDLPQDIKEEIENRKLVENKDERELVKLFKKKLQGKDVVSYTDMTEDEKVLLGIVKGYMYATRAFEVNGLLKMSTIAKKQFKRFVLDFNECN